MSQTPNEVQFNDNEIDLKELIMILWKHKLFIICLAILSAVVVGMFSKFFISPVYDTRLNIVISMPQTYNARFGEYKLPIATNEQYIKLITSNDVILKTIKDMGYKDITLELIRSKIKINGLESTSHELQNTFIVVVSAETPQESLHLAETLYKNYTNYLNIMINQRAISYFIDDFQNKIKLNEDLLVSSKENLKKNEELLKVIPETINQEKALDQIKSSKHDISNFVVLEDIINPNYTKLQEDIIENHKTINGLEDLIRVAKDNLDELNFEKQNIDKLTKDGKIDEVKPSQIGVIDTNMYLASPPVAPNRKTSPSNSKNAMIGLIGGVLLGAIISAIKGYWFEKSK